MKDYLIVLERNGEDIFDHRSLETLRLVNVSEDYANGVVKGLKLAYPDNEVYKELIKKV